MSLSFRSLNPVLRPREVSLVLAAMAFGTSAAQAQDFYFVPDVNLRAEHHTNLELNINPTADESTQGYIADVAATFGWRGPRGRTEIMPRLQFQEFPEREDLASTNQYLNLRSNYSTLKGQWGLVARYDVKDDYNAQSAPAGFDEFDPEDPVVDESGRIVLLSEQRTRVQVRPSYTHKFTERFGAQVSAVYQTVDFDVEGTLSRVNYEYVQGDAGLLWGLGPLTELATNVYTSKYQADDGSNYTYGVGGEFELEHRWTQTVRGTAAVWFENSEVDEAGVIDKGTFWGFNFGVVTQGEVSQLRATLGRDLSPTGSGSRSMIDEVRVQYDRNFTQRWQWITALRAFRTEAQGDNVSSNNNRDYARAETELRWRITPTWYVGGGYTYAWQEYETSIDSQSESIYILKVGYLGLPPQR